MLNFLKIKPLQEKTNFPCDISDVIFLCFVIFALYMIVSSIFLILNIDTNSSFIQYIMQIIISILIIIAICSNIKLKYKSTLHQAFGIYKEKTTQYLWQGLRIAIILILGTSIINLIAVLFSGQQSPNPYNNLPTEKLKFISILSIFTAPFVEETFFRGFLQPALSKTTGIISSIIFTAIIFAILHTQYLVNITDFISVIFIAITLGVARVKTESLLPCIIAHLLNNCIAVLMLF